MPFYIPAPANFIEFAFGVLVLSGAVLFVLCGIAAFSEFIKNFFGG